jgi:predicted RNase H-like HicB family nuclease
MSDKYTVHLVWSVEDNAFIASVAELPGCMADGETREGALKALDEVIADWIESAKEIGRPVPPPLFRADIEQMHETFEGRLAQHVKREVETAVQRVMREMSVSPAFPGRLDPAEGWKYLSDD